MVNFISIAFAAVILKIFKVLGPNSASMEWPFFGFFGALILPNMIMMKFSPEQLFKMQKILLKEFSQKQDASKVCTFYLTLTPCSPLKMSEIEKNKYF